MGKRFILLRPWFSFEQVTIIRMSRPLKNSVRNSNVANLFCAQKNSWVSRWYIIARMLPKPLIRRPCLHSVRYRAAKEWASPANPNPADPYHTICQAITLRLCFCPLSYNTCMPSYWFYLNRQISRLFSCTSNVQYGAFQANHAILTTQHIPSRF